MPCGLNCPNCKDPSPSIPADYSVPGFGIQRNCRNAEWALVVRAKERQEDWVEFQPRRHAFESVKPATTIRYRGEIFRVMKTEQTQAGWTYRLVLWPAGDMIQRVVELTPAAVVESRRLRETLQRSERLSEWAPFYEVVFGFLPGRLQTRLSEPYCFSPEGATRKCGLAQFLVFLILTLAMTVSVARKMNSTQVVLGLVFLVVAVEGIVRWGQALTSGEPVGFLPFELLDRLLPHDDDERESKP